MTEPGLVVSEFGSAVPVGAFRSGTIRDDAPPLTFGVVLFGLVCCVKGLELAADGNAPGFALGADG